MITIENADKALKTYYLDAVSAQLDAVSPFYAAIEKNGTEVFGKEVKVTAVRGDSSRVLAGTEDGELPAAGSNRYIQFTSALKNIYGTIEISDKALRAARSSEGAFVDLLNAEMEGLISSARVNFSRMLYGDGNGYVAAITKEEDDGSLAVTPVGRVTEGMKVDIRNSSSIMTGGENVTIASVDYAAGTITIAEVIEGTLAGKYIYVHGAYGNEITGFEALFGDDDIYGIDRDTEINSRPDMILCSYKTKSAIAELLLGSRSNVNTTVLAGGYSAILFDGIPVVADRYCPENTIYLINTNDFVLAQLCDWSWLEDEDGKILKQVPGKAAYSATLVKYAELICKKPCAQGIITGFTV